MRMSSSDSKATARRPVTLPVLTGISFPHATHEITNCSRHQSNSRANEDGEEQRPNVHHHSRRGQVSVEYVRHHGEIERHQGHHQLLLLFVVHSGEASCKKVTARECGWRKRVYPVFFSSGFASAGFSAGFFSAGIFSVFFSSVDGGAAGDATEPFVNRALAATA